MKCPICIEELLMSERNGIEIDYCPKCRGVWLDRGELDKIIERSHAAEDVPPRPMDRPAYPERRGHEEPFYGKDYKHHKHKKKSFLDDLFDF